MANVSINSVGKYYGIVEVLKGVSVDVEDGEFVILVGPSGCGKSTLLRMIAGLEDISSGDIEIGGRVVNDLPPAERDIAMVFQNYALYPHMTVRKNMAFSLQLSHVAKTEVDAKIAYAADILGLGQLLERYPRQLSGGQRQRVAMGRAIVRDPHVFLFDEPLSNLDAKLRVQMRSEIKQLHQRLKTTTIYVTHDQVEAMTMADRIVVMHDGIIEQIGTPLELYDRPRNLFVAGFIGSPSMNFIHGTLGPDGFHANDGFALPVPAAARSATPQQAIYGIRPEHFRLSQSGLKAEIVVVEPTGSETQVIVRIGNQEVVGVFRERILAKPGSFIQIEPDENLLHLFDAQGMRITEHEVGEPAGGTNVIMGSVA